MRLDIGLVGKLARQEHMGRALRHLLGHPDGAEEAALLGAYRHDLSAVAADQLFAFRAHPTGHEDGGRVAQRPAQGGEGDAGVAAGGFHHAVAGLEFTAFVGAPQDVQRHSVLDAAGEIQMLALGIDHAARTPISKIDGKQRRVADHASQRIKRRRNEDRGGW